jgi:glycosyltransferase involved in cell wall biosynthesis
VPVYGVDLEVFSPSDRPRSSLKTALGLPSTGAVVLFSSRVAPEKDADTLLLALKALRASGTELWIVNRSGGHREFAERAAQLGVGDYVLVGESVDPKSELSALYQAASICVQASREEGLGFSPLEALACGTPVIATAVGGLRETIIDGQTGWTYPRGDSRLLAEALREALANPAEARRRTELGRALVRARFERSMVFDHFMEVTHRVIDGANARGAVPEP